jgi:hypothetical protein
LRAWRCDLRPRVSDSPGRESHLDSLVSKTLWIQALDNGTQNLTVVDEQRLRRRRNGRGQTWRTELITVQFVLIRKDYELHKADAETSCSKVQLSNTSNGVATLDIGQAPFSTSPGWEDRRQAIISRDYLDLIFWGSIALLGRSILGGFSNFASTIGPLLPPQISRRWG